MNATLEMKAAGDEPRILVIQSNRTYLGVVARRLKEFGYRVATAETAANGLAEMYRVPVDLVLCDVTWPERAGSNSRGWSVTIPSTATSRCC